MIRQITLRICKGPGNSGVWFHLMNIVHKIIKREEWQ